VVEAAVQEEAGTAPAVVEAAVQEGAGTAPAVVEAAAPEEAGTIPAVVEAATEESTTAAPEEEAGVAVSEAVAAASQEEAIRTDTSAPAEASTEVVPVSEPTASSAEGFEDVKCTLNVKMEIELSKYMKQVRVLDEIATKKRKVTLIMQQIKAELGHEAKKRREEDSQTAIASASQKRGAVKGGFLNKKGGKKAPEPPSRMESLKQVFGAHPAVRERNFLCTKNIGIFVGALIFISQYGEYMAV